MKNKFSTKLTVAIFLLSLANAKAEERFYAGVDLLHSYAKHTYQTDVTGYTASNGLKTSGQSNGVGLYIGYKKNIPNFNSLQAINLDKIFIAPEIFYDYINNSADDFFVNDSSKNSQDRLVLRGRHGAKLNIGYDLTSKFSIFYNIGLAKVNYVVNWPSTNQSSAKSVTAPVYGAGISYNLTNNFGLKASYDHQKFDIKLIGDGYISKVALRDFKLGAYYRF